MNLVLIVSLFGGFATLLASILKDVGMSTIVNRRITVGVSVGMGILATIANGTTNWADAGVVVTSVMGASQGYYTLISGPLGLDQKIADAIPSPLRPILLYFTKSASLTDTPPSSIASAPTASSSPAGNTSTTTTAQSEH